MTIYNITRPEDGETCTVDTAEEVPSAELFTFCDGWDGPLDWAQVSYIESAAESLVAGEIADAKVDLASLGLELVGTRRELTPYDTGARLQPFAWREPREDEGYGNVDFDNDEGGTELTIHVSRNEDGTLTVHIIPQVADIREITIETHEEN